MGVGSQSHAPATQTRENPALPLVQKARWDPEPFWRSAENFAPPGLDPRTIYLVTIRYTD
jgi:hypothetical protein